MDTDTEERASLIDALRAKFEGFFTNRKMIVAGLALVAVGVDWFTHGVKLELEAIDEDRTFAKDTRERLFAVETIMEAEGLLLMADQEADAGGEVEGQSGDEAGAGDDTEEVNIDAEEWTKDDNPTDRFEGSPETQFPGTDVPA